MSDPPSRAGFTYRPFPAEREVVLDFMRLGERKHLIHGLIEMDVTKARARLREGGERLSFTAYMVASLARAVRAGASAPRRSTVWRSWSVGSPAAPGPMAGARGKSSA